MDWIQHTKLLILLFILPYKIILGQQQQAYLGPNNKSPEEFVRWWDDFQSWIQNASKGLDLSIYENERISWARTSFVQPQLMLHDRFLYDRDLDQWTVEKYLQDVRERYGGIDSVLLWQGYPNIGVDDRNQFDMLESLPGGIDGLREMVNHFEENGVRVLLPYLPWDQGTRNTGQSDVVSLIDVIIRSNCSGMNGDTLNGVNRSFWEESLRQHYPIAIEPEVLYNNFQTLATNVMSWAYWQYFWGILNPVAPPVSTFKAMTNGKHLGMNGDTMNGVNESFWEESLLHDYPIAIEPEVLYTNYQYLAYDVMSWNYWTSWLTAMNPIVPPVSIYKSMTHGKHLVHICERWATDRTDGLQYAFFNGMGYESWENVWGVFNQITPRDAAALKRTSKILRQFGEFFQGGYSKWTPHLPVSRFHPELHSKTFASEFRGDDKIIWLLVNRDKFHDEVIELELSGIDESYIEIAQWFDLYHGVKLENVTYDQFAHAFISLHVEAGGFGAIMTSVENVDETFLNTMAEITSKPLRDFSSEWVYLPQEIKNLENSKTAKTPPTISNNADSIMEVVEVPGGSFTFDIMGNVIEGDELPYAVDVQFPWEDSPRRRHNQLIQVPNLLVDKYPVTNADYATYISESGYSPKITQNWLKHWDISSGQPQPPNGYENKPVVWLSHSDATEFCHFYNKRLPHSWEWQWFAQGDDLFKPWPWGSADPDESKMPKFTTSERVMPPPDDVDAHPDGASWAGIEDLVGNIYQWTDVFTDIHTSRAVLRGSPHWRPDASHWYQPLAQTPLFQHNTYLLMSEGMDRNGGIGFRCVAEVL